MNSAQHAANHLWIALGALGGLIVGGFAALAAAFGQRLAPHLLDVCLQGWEAVSAQFTYRAMLLVLVVLGLAGLMFVAHLWRTGRATGRALARLLRQRVAPPARLRRSASSLRLETQVDLVEDARALAICYGWRAPRILVTTGLLDLLDDEELGAVLAHERYHLTHRDPLKILLARGLRAGLFFLPVTHDLVENYLLAQEMAADDETISQVGSRSPLARALYKMLTAESAPRDLVVSAFGRLNERIRYLVDPHPGNMFHFSFWRITLSALCVGLIFLVIFQFTALAPFAHAFDADCHRAEVGRLVHWFL